MPSVYIETYPLNNRIYECYRTVAMGYDFRGDTIEEVEAPNRFHAVVINVGRAARYLVDNHHGERHNRINIISDKDGQDVKYGGEQDAVYHLLNPTTAAEARKAISLYSEYTRYLDRIKEYRQAAGIKITLLPQGEVL